jgi:hypothetical protein
VRGLRVVGRGHVAGGATLWPFDRRPGTTLALLVRVPRGGLVDFDESASRLSAAGDDRQTDLLAGGKPAFPAARLSLDRRACMLEMRLPGTPAPGSTTIAARGTLVLKRATKKLTARKAGVPLAAGTRFSLAGVPLEILSARKLAAGPNRMELSLLSDRSYSRISGIRLIDAEGRTIRAQRWAGGFLRGNDRVKLSLGLARAVRTATVEVDYWADMRELRVPFSLKTSLGF